MAWSCAELLRKLEPKQDLSHPSKGNSGNEYLFVH